MFRVESRCTEETTSAIELLVNPLVGSFYPDVNRLGLKREEHDQSGLVSDQWSLIQFCWLFTIKDWCKKVHLQQKHIEGLLQLLLIVSWNTLAYQGTPYNVHVSTYFWKQHTRQIEAPVSAQKALQGFETEARELLVGTEEKILSRWGVIDLPSRQINYFVHKGNRKKWVSYQTCCQCCFLGPQPPLARCLSHLR